MEEKLNSIAVALLAIGDPMVRKQLASLFQGEGYPVLVASDGEMARHLIQEHACLFILLDAHLPERDGIELCRWIRARDETASTPLLLIAARDSIENADLETVVGLEVGADDYILWPINWKVLHARVRSLLRRNVYMQLCCPIPTRIRVPAREQQKRERTLSIGNLRVDLDGRTVFQQDRPIELSARLFDLLVFFVQHHGSVLPRKQLLHLIQGDLSEQNGRLLDVYIHWLREKLGNDPAHPQRIQTIRGIGYRFLG